MARGVDPRGIRSPSRRRRTLSRSVVSRASRYDRMVRMYAMGRAVSFTLTTPSPFGEPNPHGRVGVHEGGDTESEDEELQDEAWEESSVEEELGYSSGVELLVEGANGYYTELVAPLDLPVAYILTILSYREALETTD